VSAHNGATGSTIFVLEGTDIDNLFGMSVCGLPDVNGDTVADFTVGVPHDDGASIDGGRHLLYAGGIEAQCGLQLIGTPSSGNTVRLLHGGLPLSHSLVLADVSGGPTSFPPLATIALGLTPAMIVLNDSLGAMGAPYGVPHGSDGAVRLGPFFIAPGVVGMTLYLQSCTITPLAPNGFFQLSDGLAVTFTL